VVGPDGKTEFQKNIDAVTKLLAQIPADSRVTVIGITDKSFAQPDILLSASISGDAGYFGERLNAARSGLVRAWKARSSRLKPEYRHTDIIGALLVASQVFGQHSDASNKMLVIFSDMRHQTHDLEIESPLRVPSISRLRKESEIPVADLQENLREFWDNYFQETGATLDEYSVLREGPKMPSQ
jgi:hypothetical protein